MSEGETVQVAVRVRPFNTREKDHDDQTRVISMATHDQGSETRLINPDTNEAKSFKFDFSWNSHSPTVPDMGKFVDQDHVFATVGQPVLNAALDGKNVCLFAYGQTGAGKSYSMLGQLHKPDLEGIIPRICREVFKRIDDEKKNGGKSKHTIDIQIVEIYCEQINDLLQDPKYWPSRGHKPVLGVDGYTVETTKIPCLSFDDIFRAMDYADRNRSIGAHALNPESSRAHTIYKITYRRETLMEEEVSAKKMMETVSSKINLVDLAGSERTETAGTSGQMLKEGTAINLSLTALGNCIKSLSEKKRANFRDSKLTLLLQGTMTNGKVLMIAAISPSSLNYAETMSTLRFAERVKMVKIKAKANVSQDPVAQVKKEMEKMKAQMQQEIDALRAQLQAAGGGHVTDAKMQLESERKMKTELEQRVQELERAAERRVAEWEESPEERRARALDLQNSLFGANNETKDTLDPHLVNLHEDTRLTGMLIYPLKPGVTVVGRPDKTYQPDIEFTGMGIVPYHCELHWVDEKVWIVPANHSRTLINGVMVSGPTELKDKNRLWLGNNYIFRFDFPGHPDTESELTADDVDYQFAQKEMAEQAAIVSKDFGEHMSLGYKVTEAFKKVEQATIIAKDLQRDVTFKPRIIPNRWTGEEEVVVSVSVPGAPSLYWPWEKFNVRLVDMCHMWQEWQSEDPEWADNWTDENDPFIDEDYQLVGEAQIMLEPLSNMIETEVNVSVISLFGPKEASMHVKLSPCDVNGGTGPWDDDEEDLDPYVDDPQELLDTEIQFMLNIDSIQFIPQVAEKTCRFCEVFCRYKVDPSDPEEPWIKAPEMRGRHALWNVDVSFSQLHHYHVDKSFLRHLRQKHCVIQVWGKLATSHGYHASALETLNRLRKLTSSRNSTASTEVGTPNDMSPKANQGVLDVGKVSSLLKSTHVAKANFLRALGSKQQHRRENSTASLSRTDSNLTLKTPNETITETGATLGIGTPSPTYRKLSHSTLDLESSPNPLQRSAAKGNLLLDNEAEAKAKLVKELDKQIETKKNTLAAKREEVEDKNQQVEEVIVQLATHKDELQTLQDKIAAAKHELKALEKQIKQKKEESNNAEVVEYAPVPPQTERDSSTSPAAKRRRGQSLPAINATNGRRSSVTAALAGVAAAGGDNAMKDSSETPTIKKDARKSLPAALPQLSSRGSIEIEADSPSPTPPQPPDGSPPLNPRKYISFDGSPRLQLNTADSKLLARRTSLSSTSANSSPGLTSAASNTSTITSNTSTTTLNITNAVATTTTTTAAPHTNVVAISNTDPSLGRKHSSRRSFVILEGDSSDEETIERGKKHANSGRSNKSSPSPNTSSNGNTTPSLSMMLPSAPF